MVTHEPAAASLSIGAVAREETGSIALEEIFKQYAPYVAKIGFRLLGRAEEVEDLVQDVFLVAHRGLRQLRDPDAAKSWLATVAVRQSRRRLRSRRLRTWLHLDPPESYAEVADDAATPEQRAQLSAVYSILDRLPVNQRVAWTLRYVEGERLEGVAGHCGCSLATAKRWIRAAHDAIRSEMEGSHG